MGNLLTRTEVPVEETWNLEAVYPAQSDWEAALQAATDLIPAVTAYAGRLGEGAQTTLACLQARDALTLASQPVTAYATLRLSEDNTATAAQMLAARAFTLEVDIAAALSFIESELLQLPEGTLERYLQAEPRLSPYRPYFEQLISERPHALHPETEAALAALGEVLEAPPSIYQRAMTADVKYDSVVDSKGERVSVSPFIMLAFQTPAEAQARRDAYQAIIKGWSGHQHTLAASLATEIKKNVVMARLRRYDSTAAMLLNQSPIPGMQGHQITVPIYERILKTIQAGVAPHFRRYARLRRQVLGLEQLILPDMGAPLDPGYVQQISFAEGARTIREGLAVLGEEYGEIMSRGLSERWIYRGMNAGRANGAFCNFILGQHPYVFTPWNGGTRDLFIMAHELGHAGHMALSLKYQPLAGFWPSMFFIEAPSTMNELLLGNYLLASSQDVRFRRSVITSLLATYYHNFVNHLLEGELLHRVYGLAEAGEPLTAATFGEQKTRVLADFWGDELQLDEGARLFWMAQGHYYAGLYPYTYAAGLAVSTAAAQRVQEEGAPAVARWLEVLKAGGSRKPLELMQHVGVDMTTAEPLERACAFVGHLVDELEKTYA
jgi:oligoendopeptidase F